MTQQLVTIPLHSLNMHPAFQVRAELDRETVERYTQLLRNGLSFREPIKVGLIVPDDGLPAGAPIGSTSLLDLPEGTYVLLDGFHRVEAYLRLGTFEVEAELIQCTEREARWLAAQANAANGLPLHRRDYKNVLDAYVLAGRWRMGRGKFPDQAKGYREIAQDLGGVHPHTTVRNWIHKHHRWLFNKIRDGDAPTALGPKERPPMVLPHERVMLEANKAMGSVVKSMALLKREQRWLVAQEADKVSETARRLGVEEPAPDEF